MKLQYFALLLVAVLLISGCAQGGKPDTKSVQTISPPKFTPSETTAPPAFSPVGTTPPKFAPEQTSLPGLEGKLVGTWWVGKKEFKADDGGTWSPESPVDKIALKADKNWEDDRGKKGIWSVETVQASDWGAWGVSWDSSSGKPEEKIVLNGERTESGWIEQGDTTNLFWLFFRFAGDQATPAGWIQLRFEKTSDTAKIESTYSTPAFNPSQDAEIAKTKYVADLEAKLLGEWGFGTSRKLALRAGGKWELIPEAGGSSGAWELKDVTAADIKKWKDDGKISGASEILSKKLVLHDRQCTIGNKETEEIYLLIADEEHAFTSCGIGWSK